MHDGGREIGEVGARCQASDSHFQEISRTRGQTGLHWEGNMSCYRSQLEEEISISGPFLLVLKITIPAGSLDLKLSKCNPIIRWHVLQGSINAISFSTDGSYLAIVGRDGYLRVFDYHKEELLFGGKSYSGALLCCAWSHDDKYILTGGEDDLVHVWSTEAKKMVAYGEGHHSWVNGISFDSYWRTPNSDRIEENFVYRFGSVGEDARILIWNLEIDENFELTQGRDFPTLIDESTSRDATAPPPSTLHPSPRLQQLPILSPVGGNRAHVEPLSSLIIAEDLVIAMTRAGRMKIWGRPRGDETSQAG